MTSEQEGPLRDQILKRIQQANIEQQSSDIKPDTDSQSAPVKKEERTESQTNKEIKEMFKKDAKKKNKGAESREKPVQESTSSHQNETLKVGDSEAGEGSSLREPLKENEIRSIPSFPKRKRGIGKILFFIFLLALVGGGAAYGVYYWQENQKTVLKQEMEKVQKEKEETDKLNEKNSKYYADKLAREEEWKKNHETLNEDNVNNFNQNLEDNLNANVNLNTGDDTNINGGVVTDNETINSNNIIGITNQDDTVDDVEEDTDSNNESTDGMELSDNNKTTVGTGFEIPKDTPIGYIQKLYEKDGKQYMDIDYIQWFVGEAAIPEIKKDGKCAEWGEDVQNCYPISGFYIRNVNPKIRTFEISPDTEVYMTTYPLSETGEEFGGKITYEEFKRLFNVGSDDQYDYLKSEPYYIIIDHDKVIIIAEQFVP